MHTTQNHANVWLTIDQSHSHAEMVEFVNNWISYRMHIAQSHANIIDFDRIIEQSQNHANWVKFVKKFIKSNDYK